MYTIGNTDSSSYETNEIKIVFLNQCWHNGSMRLIVFVLCICLPLVASHIPEKVIICGVGKDIEKTMPYTISNLETLGALFDDYRILIYEDNSEDKSAELLIQWAEKNPKVHVQCEIVTNEVQSETCCNKTIHNTFFISERIARARNIVLDQAMNPQYDDYKYLIWIDLDFDHTFPFNEIANTFNVDKDWDAVFANGVKANGKYFDTYALRDKILPLGSEFFGKKWRKMRGKRNKPCLKIKDPWYPVLSAFGGMGIYKRKAVMGCRYSGVVTEDVEKLAERIIEKGKKEKHPAILQYLKEKKEIRHIIRLPEITSAMTQYKDPQSGFLIGVKENGLVYRMSGGVFQYPTLCEHVPLHASMILNGHDKLYINPAILLHYRER